MAVDKSSARVRRMFGQIAGRYDLLNHLLSMNIDRYWRRKTVQVVPPAGSSPILDLCTGTGDLALAYDRVAQGRCPIVGADFCHEMLVVANRKLQERVRQQQISLVEADAQRLPFADNQFQIVCVAFGLRNVADTWQGLSEMVRVAQPAGRVAILEFSRPRVPGLRGLFGWYFRNVLPRIGQWLSRNDSDAYNYLPSSVSEFPDGQRMADMLHDVGLRSITVRPMTLGVATLYVGLKANLPAAPRHSQSATSQTSPAASSTQAQPQQPTSQPAGSTGAPRD